MRLRWFGELYCCANEQDYEWGTNLQQARREWQSGWYCWRWALLLCKQTRLWMRHNNDVSSMCQMSFLPYTQSYMGTGINFQPAPIFRTGVIHFVILADFGTVSFHFPTQAKYCKLYYYTYHSILLFHSFPANTFRNVLLHFYPQTFSRPVS